MNVAIRLHSLPLTSQVLARTPPNWNAHNPSIPVPLPKTLLPASPPLTIIHCLTKLTHLKCKLPYPTSYHHGQPATTRAHAYAHTNPSTCRTTKLESNTPRPSKNTSLISIPPLLSLLYTLMAPAASPLAASTLEWAMSFSPMDKRSNQVALTWADTLVSMVPKCLPLPEAQP